jgi:hypothetical protein
MGQKGLPHLYFGKHFKLRGEKNNALLHFRTAIEGKPEKAIRGTARDQRTYIAQITKMNFRGRSPDPE